MASKQNFYQRVLPNVCIDFASVKGQEVFKNALDEGFMKAYFKLGPQLRTQDEPAYCGLSSLVIVLNALSVDPGKVWKGAWRWYHEDMLECCFSLNAVKTVGITMDGLSSIARCNQLESQIVYADDELTAEILRNEIKSACQSFHKALIVSFGRKVLGQTGSGHFSPIGGYSEKDDLVLILEPARFKYPPYWISISRLLEAMKDIDRVTEKPRGFLVLQKSSDQPTLLFRLSKAFNVMHPIDKVFACFIENASDIMKQQVSDDVSTETVIVNISKKLYKSTSLYKESFQKLFFNTAKVNDIEILSPEHQRSIVLLVEKIEKTIIFEYIFQHIYSITRGDHTFSVKRGKQNVRVCVPNDCMICFPHYFTLMICVLPIFSSDNPRHVPNLFTLSSKEVEGSYLERVVECVNKTLTNCEEIVRSFKEVALISDEIEKECLSSKIFLTEVEQLQSQVCRNYDCSN